MELPKELFKSRLETRSLKRNLTNIDLIYTSDTNIGNLKNKSIT